MENQNRDRVEIRRASAILENLGYYLEEIERKIELLNKNSKISGGKEDVQEL